VVLFYLLLEREVKMVPNKKSAAKRVLIAEKNRLYNRYWKTRCKTAAKNFLAALNGNDQEAVSLRLNEAQSTLDKAVIKGVIHRNTAARKKSKMALKVAALVKTD
jgi:small subunit ribosomal protein S20